jgi:PKD repeat protein
MKQALFLIVTIFAATPYFSQNSLLHCGADEMRIKTLEQNPKIAKAVINKEVELENFTKNFVANFKSNSTKKNSAAAATYIIPVVFHVIHNYGIENISDLQIKDGLDILNKTFRKLRPDTASIVSVFKSIHADCDIEFRLAQKDPNGNCHSGINRIASPTTLTGGHEVKNLIHWPPNKYLNVYIVSNAAGLAGHCVWPSDADTIPLWDGIVIGHNYMGTIGTSNLTQSVAFAHECGHYFNLHHIWGGNNVPGFYYYPCAVLTKDCMIDDLVADTPPTIGWQSCNLAGASCGNVVDNVQNAMDYSYCNIMFTQGQKARMHACLNSTIAARSNLWSTPNLIATGVYTNQPLCKADFTSDKKVICPSNQVIFTNTSFNGTFTSVSWKFQGGTPSTSSVANPTVTYSTAGSYSVELKVKNGIDSVSLTKLNYISVQTTTGAGYPYSEGFETVTNLNGTEWLTNNLDSSNTWQLTNLASASGSKCIMINNFSSTLNGKDELYSRAINLTGATSLNISFKYAFARKDTSNKDQLQLLCMMNCNGSAITRFNATGALLETTAPKTVAFYPANYSEWKLASNTILAPWFTSGFRFKFIFNGKGGNNIFIDDINISIDAGLNTLSEDVNDLKLFPNPATDETTLSFNLNRTKTYSVIIYNLLGEKVSSTKNSIFNEGENSISIPTNELKNGMYYISLTDGFTTINKPLVVSKK